MTSEQKKQFCEKIDEWFEDGDRPTRPFSQYLIRVVDEIFAHTVPISDEEIAKAAFKYGGEKPAASDFLIGAKWAIVRYHMEERKQWYKQ